MAQKPIQQQTQAIPLQGNMNFMLQKNIISHAYVLMPDTDSIVTKSSRFPEFRAGQDFTRPSAMLKILVFSLVMRS